MTVSEMQWRFSIMIALLVAYSFFIGIKFKILELNRSKAKQQFLVDTGKSHTMESKHRKNLAIDIAILDKEHKPIWDKERYRKLGEFWEFLGGIWGGRFGVAKENFDKEIGWDAGHFEYA